MPYCPWCRVFIPPGEGEPRCSMCHGTLTRWEREAEDAETWAVQTLCGQALRSLHESLKDAETPHTLKQLRTLSQKLPRREQEALLDLVDEVERLHETALQVAAMIPPVLESITHGAPGSPSLEKVTPTQWGHLLKDD